MTMYYPLNEENACDYIRKTPLMDTLFKGVDDLKAVDLAEGNINLIFRVFSERDPIGKSVLVKQAMPHSRRYPDFKLPQSRAKLENEMLEIENKYCPGSVPRVYFYDADMFAILMEDLNRHIIMRYGLMKQVRYPLFAEHIGTFLARTLFYTSDLYLAPSDKKPMVAAFINPVLCKITEDLVFTEPYIDHPNNHWTDGLTPHVKKIHADDSLRSEMMVLKEAFITHAQALVHGDLHTGSIMVNESETRVIDPEFGYFGPMGFDIGAVLGNLVLSYASQEFHAGEEKEREAYRAWLLDTIREVWTFFEKEFNLLWDTQLNDQWSSEGFREKYILSLLQDTAGFGAAKIMRRVIGLAQVPDMWTIEDPHIKAVAESMALSAAQAWVMNRRMVQSINDLVEMVREARPDPQVK